MTKAEQTRQFIIETAAPVFNTKGYESTSLSDIQEATKLTKGAIYGNFTDKNELAVAAYEYNSLMTYTRIKNVMEAQPTAKKSLTSFADFYKNNWDRLSERGGCPMLNAAVEADDHLDFLKNPVRKSIKRIMRSLQQTIEKGQANHEFNPKISAQKYAAIIFSIIEGNIILAKIMDDAKYLHNAADRISLIINKELML